MLDLAEGLAYLGGGLHWGILKFIGAGCRSMTVSGFEHAGTVFCCTRILLVVACSACFGLASRLSLLGDLAEGKRSKRQLFLGVHDLIMKV